MTNWRYLYSDVVIASSFPFPELEATASGLEDAVELVLGDGVFAAPNAAVDREWRMPDGSLWTTFQRVGEDWFVDFPEYAGFLVAGTGGGVSCFPAVGAAMSTVRHLLLNQILPLVMSARGRHTFHASAVEVNELAAVFSGESGKGKSTLALHFARSGDRFLSDDLVVFEKAAEGWQVLPSYPSLRVCKDSLEQAGAENLVVTPSAEYSEKARVPAGEGVGFQNRRVRLGAMYFLGEDTTAVKIRPVAGAESIVELVRSSFMLDTTRRSYLKSHLDWAAELAETGRLFRLDYPRDFGRLDETRAVIDAHIRSLN